MTAENINQTVAKKVGSDEIISSINQSAENVTINASKINFNGIVTANSRFKILKDGSFVAAYGNVGGWKVRNKYIQSSDNTITLYSDGRIEIGNATISSVFMLWTERRWSEQSAIFTYPENRSMYNSSSYDIQKTRL